MKDTPEAKAEFVTIDFETFSETFMLNFYFECAPPENQRVFMGLGRDELTELRDIIDRALSPAQPKKEAP